MNREARGGGNSNCRWAGILIVASQNVRGDEVAAVQRKTALRVLKI